MARFQPKGYTPAKTLRQFRGLLNSDPEKVKFIRSREDWKEYSQDARSSDHPLKRLTDDDLEEINETIKFKGGGLTTLNVAVLKRRLTESEYAVVLNHFGIDPVLAADFEDYQCVGAGNCKAAGGYICTSNC